MTNIFQLTDTLFGVDLPMDAEFELINSVQNTSWVRYWNKDFSVNGQTDLPNGEEYETLGTATKDSIDFDCEPYVEKCDLDRYINYNVGNDAGVIFFINKDDSFRSLIAEKSGKTFTNPLVEKPERMTPFMHAGHYTDNQKYKIEKYQKELQAWQQAENNLLKKVVIIQKIK